MKRFKTVDEYVAAQTTWQDEIRRLRQILQSTPLNEEVKWGGPCYTYKGKNVVGMAAFKSYFGLWFHQGALLSDPDGVLLNCQEGKTRALRQWRMESKKDIKATRIKAYVREAMKLVDAGKEIKPQRDKPLELPAELVAALKKNRAARAAFDKLSKGRQREYAEHIAEAKRDETRARRLAKILPMIAAGIGLHDKYR